MPLQRASSLVLLVKEGVPPLLPDSGILFGDKTWDDVRRTLMRRLNKKYGGRVQPADLEDSVASAMVDLVDYWVHLPSSVAPENPARNFNFAVTRGYWMASSFVYRRVSEQSYLVSLDEKVVYGPEMVVAGPEPEDFEPTEEAKVREFLATLPEEEFTGWLDDYLAGRSERVTARKHNTYPNTIHRRRVAGLRRLRSKFHAYVIASG